MNKISNVKIKAIGDINRSLAIIQLEKFGVKRPLMYRHINHIPNRRRNWYIIVSDGMWTFCSKETFITSPFKQIEISEICLSVMLSPEPIPKWDARFLNLAKQIAQWSKDPSTKCGAVIVRPDKSIASTGYNGFPPGIDDNEQWLHDREIKYGVVRHAEENAFSFCRDSDLTGYTLYVWPFMPCSNCMSEISINKIARVVSITSKGTRWEKSFAISRDIAVQSNIKLDLYTNEQFTNEKG